MRSPLFFLPRKECEGKTGGKKVQKQANGRQKKRKTEQTAEYLIVKNPINMW